MTRASAQAVARLFADPNHTPDADDVLAVSAKLEARLAETDIGELVDDAISVIHGAAQSGAVTWDSDQRSDLRRTLLWWGTTLQRAGHRIAVPDLEPFSGQLPTLDAMSGDEALSNASSGEPIVARQLKDADLRGLSGAVKIFDCALENCDLRGVTLKGARLIHTTFAGCHFDGAALPDVVATSSIFAGGDLSHVVAENGTFNGSRFTRVTMAASCFDGSSFGATVVRSLDLTNTSLVDALFDLTTIEQVRFDGAKLRRALFIGGAVRSCTFHDGADLTQAIFSSTSLHGSDFRGAELSGASFEKAADLATVQLDATAFDVAQFSRHDAELGRGKTPSTGKSK